jgi:hypothetical protein
VFRLVSPNPFVRRGREEPDEEVKDCLNHGHCLDWQHQAGEKASERTSDQTPDE